MTNALIVTRVRAIIMCVALVSMATGLLGGLSRIGVDLPVAPHWADMHGPVMICGLFGTLIALERATAYGRAWAYLAPACFGAAGLAMIAGLPTDIAGPLILAGSALFVAISAALVILQPAIFTGVLLAGVLALASGNALLVSGSDIPSVSGYWLAFLVCTIVAERLELSRILGPQRPASIALVGLLALFVAGASMGLMEQPGRTLGGIGLLGTVGWLSRYDIAPRTIRTHGRTRFMAAAMIAGYAWLAVTGAYLLAPNPAVHDYDLLLHAVFVGFVLSMVLGHALIIFPALTGVMLRYSPWLYVPLGLLHLAVAARVVGDFGAFGGLRIASGVVTALALLAFVCILAIASRAGRWTAGASTPPGPPMQGERKKHLWP
jgi:hypothetical protein